MLRSRLVRLGGDYEYKTRHVYFGGKRTNVVVEEHTHASWVKVLESCDIIDFGVNDNPLQTQIHRISFTGSDVVFLRVNTPGHFLCCAVNSRS